MTSELALRHQSSALQMLLHPIDGSSTLGRPHLRQMVAGVGVFQSINVASPSNRSSSKRFSIPTPATLEHAPSCHPLGTSYGTATPCTHALMNSSLQEARPGWALFDLQLRNMNIFQHRKDDRTLLFWPKPSFISPCCQLSNR